MFRTTQYTDYTYHDVGHSERVIAKLEKLTSGLTSSERPLNKHEVFILLAAAYLHDVGMQYAGQNLSRDEIRDRHAELSYEMNVEA